MIIDTAQVSLMDGTTRAAIDVYPGWEIVTIHNNRMKSSPVVKKTVENQTDVVCLILSSGERLIGSRDQRIATFKNKRNWFTQMADIEVGAELAGAVAGANVVVRVVGIMYHPRKEVRMVGFTFPKHECFVAEGVLCR
jgi:hypothetical protein